MKDNVKVILIIVTVFLIGLFTGIGVITTFLYINKPPTPFGKPIYDKPFFPRSPEMKLERMTRSLDLTLDQQEKVKRIIDSTRDKMMAFRKKSRPEMRSIMGQCRNEIESILTDEQKEMFKELRRKGKKRFGRQGRRGKNSIRDKRKGFRAFEPSPKNP
jgi:Spy/CpxP family protein refolding chaperone